MSQGDLVAAVVAGDLAKVEKCKQDGVDVNFRAGEYGRTPLHEAAVTGSSSMIDALVRMGADVNATNADEHGWTSLHEAAFHAGTDAVAALLRHGGDPAAFTVSEIGRASCRESVY
jgi:ankyrin repeat protein